jgi:hypothetical protein
MPQNYKILGQAFLTPNTLTNVYVTGASTSAVINSIYAANQSVPTSNVELILRPIDEPLANRHTLVRNQVIQGTSTLVLNLGITMGPNMILAANTTFADNQPEPPIGVANVSYGAFGLEIT